MILIHLGTKGIWWEGAFSPKTVYRQYDGSAYCITKKVPMRNSL